MAVIDRIEFNADISQQLKEIKHYGNQVGENWPVVYILNNEDEAYVGETRHASVRMHQHWMNPQRRLLKERMLISGEDFNKSVILDLESFLIKHMGADGKFKLQNGNNGLQDHDYYNRTKYEESFRKIWNKLKNIGIADHTIREIENSNLYKYSPYKSLGEEQLIVERDILTALETYGRNDRGVTVIVRGGAGTGKTILAIYLMKLFADIKRKIDVNLTYDDYRDEDAETNIASESLRGIERIGIVFPQATLRSSVIDVFDSISSLDKNMVYSTTGVVDEFIKSGQKFDLLIIDEAHRLKCRYKGHLSSYPKFDECSKAVGMDKEEGNELEWMLQCSRNQIIFRDELQTVRPCDIDAGDFRRILDKKNGHKIVDLGLETQWRCEGGNDYINYIKKLLGETHLERKSFQNYDFKLYRDVDRMVESIKKKDAEIGLCRNAAGYAWKWLSKKDKNAYDIEIQGHKYRWNSTYENWIAKENSVNEIGCIHTLQGYDLNYVGLIIGEDIKYDENTCKIYADKNNYYDQQGKSGVADNPEALKEYLLNIYLTLMTRGIKGTYIYVCDDALRKYFEKYIDVIE